MIVFPYCLEKKPHLEDDFSNIAFCYQILSCTINKIKNPCVTIHLPYNKAIVLCDESSFNIPRTDL